MGALLLTLERLHPVTRLLKFSCGVVLCPEPLPCPAFPLTSLGQPMLRPRWVWLTGSDCENDGYEITDPSSCPAVLSSKWSMRMWCADARLTKANRLSYGVIAVNS